MPAPPPLCKAARSSSGRSITVNATWFSRHRECCKNCGAGPLSYSGRPRPALRPQNQAATSIGRPTGRRPRTRVSALRFMQRLTNGKTMWHYPYGRGSEQRASSAGPGMQKGPGSLPGLSCFICLFATFSSERPSSPEPRRTESSSGSRSSPSPYPSSAGRAPC